MTDVRALSGVRVLDLTDRQGELAGRLLADLGATVCKIERNEGCSTRRLPPFDGDGRSLYWACYGAGKESAFLDLEQPSGREQFLQLVDHADVLIEDFSPGVAAGIHIDYEDLRTRNPRLIHLAITPYGRHGPKANWPATELTLEAAGGRVAIQGDADRPPLPVGYPQAYLHAGAQAAADITVALNEREQSGLGQFLDLSIQEVMWWTVMGAQGYPVAMGTDPPGVGDDRGNVVPEGGARIMAAHDGLVIVAPGASPPGTRTMFTFAVEEAQSRGECMELDRYDWDNWVALYRSGELPMEDLQVAIDALAAYVGRRTKLELVDWALENNLRLGPINTTKDLVDFPQYREREFFTDVGGIFQPAKWVHLSRTPLDHSPAPNEGEWNRDAWSPRAQKAVDVPAADRTGNAFEGLKVADFSWVAAGPTIAKALGDHGATVVKVESAGRPDLSRTLPPHMDGEPGLNRSYWSFLYATSKLSLQCNLGTQAGQRLARQVCDWADVVIESFSPGTMARFGIDYQTLSKDHPDLIMLSTSMLGQSGHLSAYAGFGQQASGFCGFHYITGWPDREPCGVATPYTDVIAPKFGIASLGAALLDRRESGLGQHIDLAQAECSMMFLAPLILDQVVNGNTAERTGFDSIYAAPQGIYPCAGTERYIAIAVETIEQWRGLARLIPGFPFDLPEFDDLSARMAQRAAINDAVAAWTGVQEPFALAEQLATLGIPASVVQRPMDVYTDPQIEARELKQTLAHTECGEVVHYGFCTRFSAKETMVRTAPPCIGEHNDFVMRSLLGMNDAEVTRMYEEGAIE